MSVVRNLFRLELVIAVMLLVTTTGIVTLASTHPPLRQANNSPGLVGGCYDTAFDCACDTGDQVCMEWDPENGWIIFFIEIPVETVEKVVAGAFDVAVSTIECGVQYVGNAVTGVCDLVGSIFKSSAKKQ